MGLLQTHKFIGTGIQGDTEAAHTGTQCDVQANSMGLLQMHKFIGTGTQGDLQAHSSDIQGNLQAGTSTDVSPSTHVIVCMLEDGIKNIFRREERLSELAEILGTSEDSVMRRKGLFSTRNLACCSSDMIVH
jgi:hypothetical protein